MEIQQLRNRIEEIEKEANIKKKEAMKEFCIANNSVHIGDIVSDHIGSIRVEKIRFWYGNDTPCCVYSGPELKKNLDQRKIRSVRDVWQFNIKV